MKGQHTPGPWKIREDNLGCKEIFGPPRPEEPDYETDIATTNGLYLEKEDWANARLIAAAPDLLAALEELYNALDSCVALTPAVLKQAKKAIAAAKGEG